MTNEAITKTDHPSGRGGKRQGAGRPTNAELGLRKLITTAKALVPVEVEPSTAPARLAITSPTGFRVDGLTFEQACLLLRVLS